MYQDLAVVGATGAVGALVRQLLVERAFPYTSIKFLASERSAGTEIEFDGRNYEVEVLRPEAFEAVDLAIASTPDEVSREFVPWAVEKGAVVESGAWRMQDGVPWLFLKSIPTRFDSIKGLSPVPIVPQRKWLWR